MIRDRRTAAFLLLSGVFQWVVWPTFLRNVAADPRSFAPYPTGFFWVHAALTLLSLAMGTGLLVVGARAWRR